MLRKTIFLTLSLCGVSNISQKGQYFLDSTEVVSLAILNCLIKFVFKATKYIFWLQNDSIRYRKCLDNEA